MQETELSAALVIRMVNIILEGLPDTVDINGVAVPINTDFRLWLKLEHNIENKKDISEIVSEIFYGKRPDADSEDISEAVLFFYRCGEETPKVEENSETTTASKRIFDIDYDCRLLYAAFWEHYGISLASDELHWWAYRALFFGLPEECRLSKIMGFRGVEITSDMSSKQQEYYRKMQKKYALPLPEEQQKEIDAITNVLLNDGDLTGVI